MKIATREYVSDHTSTFIGKTDRFLFMYNFNDLSTDIIPVGQIIEFKLKMSSNEDVNKRNNLKPPEIKQGSKED